MKRSFSVLCGFGFIYCLHHKTRFSGNIILSWRRNGSYSSSCVESMKGVVYVAPHSISLLELSVILNIVKFVMPLSSSGDFVFSMKNK